MARKTYGDGKGPRITATVTGDGYVHYVYEDAFRDRHAGQPEVLGSVQDFETWAESIGARVKVQRERRFFG